VRRFALERLRQIDDVDRLERALLDADAAADAQLLGDPRDLVFRSDLDAQFAFREERENRMGERWKRDGREMEERWERDERER
jgi:hypothetical protein